MSFLPIRRRLRNADGVEASSTTGQCRAYASSVARCPPPECRPQTTSTRNNKFYEFVNVSDLYLSEPLKKLAKMLKLAAMRGQNDRHFILRLLLRRVKMVNYSTSYTQFSLWQPTVYANIINGFIIYKVAHRSS